MGWCILQCQGKRLWQFEVTVSHQLQLVVQELKQYGYSRLFAVLLALVRL